ncbi:hypothetical protein [uncultured Jatrophihabitans sp.]|uniref:hypothetical protein n=1 Tax=uncultured Jatrophihabitans sp. TaxID=1610747 RepID=UPI0035CC89ED
MSAEFEFHLKGTNAPEGQLDADHLLAIVLSLKEVATKISRTETDAEAVGRPPARVQRVAKLLIGLVPGSTTVLARRAGAGDGALDFDLPDEQAFDERFEALVESIADDQRPNWVSDSLSLAAKGLAESLQEAAAEVEFRVGGRPRRSFKTVDIHREIWQVATKQDTEAITFVGWLYSANLNSHRLHVRDDVGHRVALPEVLDDAAAGRLLGNYVTVVGSPAHNSEGRLTEILGATIEAAPNPLDGGTISDSVSIEDILASAPGPDPAASLHLTDEEAEAFFDAMGL